MSGTGVDEFELVEDHVPDGGPPAPASRHHRLWSRPAPWAAAAVGLVLLGSVAAEPLVQLAGEGPGIELGIVDLPLAETPDVAWEASYPNPQLIGVEDDVAVLLIRAESGQNVIGLDLADGGEVWRYRDTDQNCQRALPITCVEQAGTQTATVVTIASADGAPTRTEHPGAVGAITAGEDLVVVEPGPADIEQMVLLEPDGSERWRVQTDAADTSATPAWVWLWIDRGHVVADLSGIAIDLVTGAVADRTMYTVGGGAWAEITPEETFIIHTADGSLTVADGEIPTLIDDDAGGPVMLHQGPELALVATLRDTDSELWRITDECYPQARVRHRFLMMCPGATGIPDLVGVDELTGERVWEQPFPAMPAVASDDTVLTIGTGEDGGLQALDPVTGAQRWQLPGPGYYYDAVEDGTGSGLLIIGESSLSRLVWE